MDFSEWLKLNLRRLDWSQRELSRQSGVGQSTISALVAGTKRPSGEVCRRLAVALGEPEEVLLRIAGYISAETDDDDPALQEAMDLLRSLTPEQRQDALKYLRFLKQQD